MPGASRWNPGPRERANTGSSAESVPQTSAQPGKGAVAPGMAPSASYPPSPPRDLGFPPATSVEPQRPGEQGADPAGRARSGQGEVPTSQKGRERPASSEEREQRAALDRGARRERSQAESEGRARGPVGQGPQAAETSLPTPTVPSACRAAVRTTGPVTHGRAASAQAQEPELEHSRRPDLAAGPLPGPAEDCRIGRREGEGSGAATAPHSPGSRQPIPVPLLG